MKKIALSLIGLFLSGTVMAHTVRIINADPLLNMSVQYCASTTTYPKCDQPLKSIELPHKMMGKNYADIRVPTGGDSAAVQIVNVTVNGAQNTYASQTCEGSKSGDTIVLNSYGTDTVVCDDRGVIEAKERN